MNVVTEPEGNGAAVLIRASSCRYGLFGVPEIGVEYAGAWARRLLRFYLQGNPHVSRPCPPETGLPVSKAR